MTVDNIRSYRPLIFLALLSAVSLSGYLLTSKVLYGWGFPLDDAWIHQTYARNLAEYGEWSFIIGQPSAGSTSPLWSGLLALGHLTGIGPYFWTYFLGWVLLFATSVIGMLTFQELIPARTNSAIWAGIFLVFEWHLVWAAGSGMETLLFALFVLLVFYILLRGVGSWLGLGALIGLCVWIRPDGITLIGPALLALFFVEASWNSRLKKGFWFVLGVLLFVVPYLLFNHYLSGSMWPNTFFAKQAEYAVHTQRPLWERFLAQANLPLIGAGALLSPGFVIIFIWVIRKNIWGVLAGVAWLLGYFLIYAIRLPVTYQHGRYIIPAMPVYFIWSIAGVAYWVSPSLPIVWKRVVSRAWLLAIGLLLAAFWVLGARAYAYDVAIIESEMVKTARWIADSTEPEALVAAHDIGALGYFGGREILDLAGLVSPEVIPFIRNEARLEAFIDERGANYLMTFPSWYQDLIRRGELVFISSGTFSPAEGGENMAVYRWREP